VQIKDLGVIDAPVVLFGGPYSNLQATQALIAAAGARRLVCTGDMVAYCADGNAVVEALGEAGADVVAGNCEKQLAVGADECGCGFGADSTCSLLARGWYAHAMATVSAASRAAMAACPDLAMFDHQGARVAVIHGGVTDVSAFLWPVSEDAAFMREIAALEAIAGPVDVIVAGHSGIAFERQIGAHRWINAGAIGMPENDGSAQTRYVVLDGEARVERLSYDHTGAQDAMVRAGLTQGYHEALATGYWPSEDVLPMALRRGA
jgi:predicted phosphodiesterase